MPTLEFKGKQHIYAHHLTVPYRPLEPDENRSCFPSGTDDNLIIHGDNLHALKALLPRYAGRVKCIYIDPPYNTGNEGWVYNDKVNSPLMKEWLKDNAPVDNEDLERHDKWLCMMWPRLHLLKELLAEDGVIFVSIDDNEQHHLRMLMDEIFGEENFFAVLTRRAMHTVRNSSKDFNLNADYVLAYAKEKPWFGCDTVVGTFDSLLTNPQAIHAMMEMGVANTNSTQSTQETITNLTHTLSQTASNGRLPLAGIPCIRLIHCVEWKRKTVLCLQVKNLRQNGS